MAGSARAAAPPDHGRRTTADPASSPPPATPLAEGPRATAGWPPEGLPVTDRDALVTRYGHLVKYVVGRLGVSIPGVFDHEDAMQAGAIGLLQAIDQYRPEAAASFESYALIRIRGSILDAVRALDVVGRAAREAARAIEAAMRDLHEELGRPADDAEVADRLGLPLDRYRERLAGVSIATVSLDALVSGAADDDRPAPGETLIDEHAPDPLAEAERRDDVDRLATAIGGLEERQRLVLHLYFRDELTLREIGEVLGVTESRVSQIRSAAILALRAAMGHAGGRRPGRPGRGRPGDDPAAGPALPLPSLPLRRSLTAAPAGFAGSVGSAGRAVATGSAYFSTRSHR